MEEVLDILEDGEILEPSTNAPYADPFLLSRVTREPKTICSDESSNENENSEESDDDSDHQCTTKKKLKLEAPKAPPSSQNPNKYKVWSVTLQEQSLTENLVKCDVDAIDRERSVESYNYKLADQTDYSHNDDIGSDYIGFDEDDVPFQVGSKRHHGDVKKRLGPRKTKHYFLPKLTSKPEDPEDEVAREIASKLRESKADLILNVVLVLGREKAIELYNETREIENNGGMLLMHENRRRTSGGVYFLLIKRDNSITPEDTKNIFSEDMTSERRRIKMTSRKRRKRKNQKFKETLIREKLLNLNTTAMVQDTEVNHSDRPSEARSNNLEDGELEPTEVTNPPPSPATDQETTPSRVHVASSEDEAGQLSDVPLSTQLIQQDNLGPPRKIISYDDSDNDDYLDVDFSADDMDVF